MRKKGNPFLYINSLFNLFKQTLSTNFVDLFANYVNSPRILLYSQFYLKNKKSDKIKFKIDKEEIIKFNNLFIDEKVNININYHDEEEYDSYENEEGDVTGDPEEKDLEDNYEEDEYAEEEEEEGDEYNKEMNGINKYNEGKLLIKEEKIKFTKLVNDEVIKKIFDLYENKQKTISNNNQLLKESIEYSNKLNKFLKSLRLI